MIDILLINSPIYDEKSLEKENFLPPLGLGYIATNLLNNKISVKIIDAVYENYVCEDIHNIIVQESPKFIGINIFSVNYTLVKKIIEKCESSSTFIIGGKSCDFLYENIIEFKTKNKIIVVIGEGDYITSDIVKEKILEKPIICRNNREVYKVDRNSIYYPKDLGRLKLNRKLFENRSIENIYGLYEESIITSRGCLYNCAFCGGAMELNKEITVRENVVSCIKEDIVDIQNVDKNVQCIRVLDDLFLKNEKSMLDAIDVFSCFRLKWRAMAHIQSFNSVSDDIINSLRQSGCIELEIGIESGNDEIRKKINKIGNADSVYCCIMRLLKLGINIKGYFIFGFPEESEQAMNDTMKLFYRLSENSTSYKGTFRGSAFQFRPYHGTKIYYQLIERGISDLSFSINEGIDSRRKQFNITAGNFSLCTEMKISEFINEINKRGK